MKKSSLIAIVIFITCLFISSATMAGTKATATNKAEAKTLIGDIGSGNETYDKKLLNPSSPQVTPLITSFQQPNDGYAWVPTGEAFLYKRTFTMEEIKNILAENPKGKRVIRRFYCKKVKKEDIPKEITIFIDTEAFNQSEGREKLGATAIENRESLGMIIVASKSEKSVTPDVAAQVMKEAMEYGASGLHLTGEGAANFLKAFGWSLSTGGITTATASSGKSGSLGMGGIGVANANSGTIYYPWIQAHALK